MGLQWHFWTVLISGHTRQGLKCRLCKTNVHVDCQEKVPAKCQPKSRLLRRQKSTSEIETRVTPAAPDEEGRLTLFITGIRVRLPYVVTFTRVNFMNSKFYVRNWEKDYTEFPVIIANLILGKKLGVPMMDSQPTWYWQVTMGFFWKSKKR